MIEDIEQPPYAELCWTKGSYVVWLYLASDIADDYVRTHSRDHSSNVHLFVYASIRLLTIISI